MTDPAPTSIARASAVVFTHPHWSEPVAYRCAQCGDEDVVFTSITAWDPARQRFAHVFITDDAECARCGPTSAVEHKLT